MVSYRIHPYRLPLSVPWDGARAVREGFLLEARKERAVGWGEAAPAPRDGRAKLEAVAADLRRGVRGLPTRTPEARAAFTQAKLDLEAQRWGVPVWKVLGPLAPPPRWVPVNAVIPRGTPRRVVSWARQARRRGFRTLKIKVGAGPEWVRVVERVRDALGPRVGLRLDANGAWNERTAPLRLRALQPLGIEYVEDPVASGPGLVRIARSSPIPIAPDQALTDLWTAQRLLATGAFKTAVAKPALMGGLDRWRVLAQWARDRGVRLVPSDRLETAIGRAGALHAACILGANPPACGLDGGRWFRRDVVAKSSWRDGPSLRVPRKAGLGWRPARRWRA